MSAKPTAPHEGQIVFVEGGIAQYRHGVFYTGMEWPLWSRVIQWEVKCWLPITGLCDVVRAVNAHEALLEVLKDMVDGVVDGAVIQRARRAIKLAEEQT